MTIQDILALQRSLEPQVLEILQNGPLRVRELCDRFGAPDYIIKRAFWALVSRGQVRMTSDYAAALVIE